MGKIEKSTKIGNRELTLSCGHVAQQASGAVIASLGETVVLATVMSSAQDTILDYFPLTVEYQEKLYAGGRIKGSRWIKREGRPSDDEILTARLIDRSIRPLFPENYKKDVQLIITVLSMDLENSPQIVAGIAASAAIAISDVPWNGPTAIAQVGLKDGKHIVNPTEADLASSDMNLIVSITKDAVVMIEADGNQVSEEDVIKGVFLAQEEGIKIINLINELVEKVGVKKQSVEKEQEDKSISKKVKELIKNNLPDLISRSASKEAGFAEITEMKASVVDSFNDREKQKASSAFENLLKKEVRNMILSGKRPDGRKYDEIRDLSCSVSFLPRTHGSALFNRGQTQALSIATLGAPSLEQFIETASGEETKRYIHHYGMPPYSTGETGRIGSPSRREIGHGALAEKALLPVIPTEEEFPYTVQVVTEILSSNGSTSMASACGSTLALMDAGVPIKSPIAGIAIGLVVEDDKHFEILTDIVGIEDGNGDMDFKVAGSEKGITALQLDVKTLKLTTVILEKALKQAREARLHILAAMNKTISKPRDKVSVHAPKIEVLKIDKEKIGELIGPGGRIIKGIIAQTQAQIDVDDDGTVFISAETEEKLKEAVAQVEATVKDPQAGEIYDGIVKKVQTFGVFVEILPGRSGLVHVSDISEDYVSDPGDMFRVGDKVQVRVKGIDDLNRLNLSMLLDPASDKRKEEMKRNNNRSDVNHGTKQRFYNRGGGNLRSSGPHFPTSRFLDESRKKSR